MASLGKVHVFGHKPVSENPEAVLLAVADELVEVVEEAVAV